MHFFQAIVSSMLIIGCMALTFPSYDMKAGLPHGQAEPNAPAKLAHRVEVAPRAEVAPRLVDPPRRRPPPRRPTRTRPLTPPTPTPTSEPWWRNWPIKWPKFPKFEAPIKVIVVVSKGDGSTFIFNQAQTNSTTSFQGPLEVSLADGFLQFRNGDKVLFSKQLTC
ncbi:hypothetical protein BHE90_002560 [Fusarium euwallaceae]|uniref:Uncharacterized protein n=2 Tax=Fusarium solani species complex TaxID=232080 RepID=A0A430M4K5_9HYPO|nr:hypothetical protein CEP53_001988 [Fusarium sp. AF-6]RSL98000.1 hypothetical protein CDV31_012797 [Fusarium ambrosium]RTE82948.1 hypothetical protein BHE90_002560 [Fusarium euwallaceae]